MSTSDTVWESNESFPDLTIFVGAELFTDFAGLATLPAAPAAGLIYKTVPSGDAAKFFSSLHLLLRSGVYATTSRNQEQFGTAAGVPGPTTVANTGDPLALAFPKPPVLNVDMATVGGVSGGAGILRGPKPKGIRINSVDVIYQVLAVNAAAATMGLTNTSFANLVAPVVTNLIALAANGLPTVIGAHPQVTNVAVPSPAFINTTLDTEPVLNVNLTAGAGGTINFYGAVIKANFNLA